MINLADLPNLVAAVKPGDVLMIAREMQDKRTNKDFTWRYFAVALDVRKYGRIEYLRLNDREDEQPRIHYCDDQLARAWLLDPEEWPDGVHALRMKLILQGRLDEVI